MNTLINEFGVRGIIHTGAARKLLDQTWKVKNPRIRDGIFETCANFQGVVYESLKADEDSP